MNIFHGKWKQKIVDEINGLIEKCRQNPFKEPENLNLSKRIVG
jgi:hypothetical protein